MPSPIIAETRYDVKLPNGGIATQVRFDRADGSKSIEWERDGKPGLHGYSVETVQLYASDRLGADEDVILVEGPKTAQAVNEAGYTAVGTMTGANTVPAGEMLGVLSGHRVYLWPDHDDVGRQHMERIGRALRRLGVEVYVITWIDAPEPGDDAVEFLQAGGNIADLMTAATPFVPISSLPFKPVAEFVASVPAEREWVVEPYIAVGTLNLIHGEPKAGKTTLVQVGMVKAILEGGTFLGHRVEQGPVVYLTEEGPYTLVEPLRAAGIDQHPDLHVLDWHDVAGRPWGEVAAETVEWAAAIGARLVVIDSLAQWAGFEEEKEQDSGAMLRALRPLSTGRREAMAVLVIHHARKAGGSVISAARGSGAVAAGVDMVMHVAVPSGMRNTVRELSALGRVLAPARQLVELKGDHYGTIIGDAGAVSRDDILRVLPTDSAEAMHPKDIGERVGRKETFVRGRLDVLVEQGFAGAVGEGKPRNPRFYFRVDDSTAAKEEGTAGGTSDE